MSLSQDQSGGDDRRGVPRVVVVREPARWAVHPLILVFALLFGVAGVACLWFFCYPSPNSTVIDHWAHGLGIVFFPLMAVLICWLYWKGNRDHCRRSGLDGWPCEDSVVAREIARVWWIPGGPPVLRRVRRILENASDGDENNAWIVCLGQIVVPSGGDYRFEPEVVSPTRAVAGHFNMIGVGLVMSVLLLAISPFLPLPLYVKLVGVVLTSVIGAVIPGVYWLIRALVRPAYLRIAPGVVQVMSYRPFSNEPRVHSYPAAAGTLVILTRINQEVSIRLSRDGVSDRFDLSGVVDQDRVCYVILQGLLSTAATPPLSEEWLVG